MATTVCATTCTRLAALGCAPLFILPGTKQPADMRTPQPAATPTTGRLRSKRRPDPVVATGRSVKSQAAGYIWRPPTPLCSTSTLIATLSNRSATPWRSTLRYRSGAAGSVVVDCDTAGQVAKFLADAGYRSRHNSPTVITPGSVDPVTGEWLHSEGGHFYFVVPEAVELPGPRRDHDGRHRQRLRRHVAPWVGMR